MASEIQNEAELGLSFYPFSVTSSNWSLGAFFVEEKIGQHKSSFQLQLTLDTGI